MPIPGSELARPDPTPQYEIEQHRNDYAGLFRAEVPDKLLVIGGPCSLDSQTFPNGESPGIKHLDKLSAATRRLSNVELVLRTVITKPRTTIDWRGIMHERGGKHRAASMVARVQFHTENGLAAEVMGDGDYDVMEPWLSMAWVGARNVTDTETRHLLRPAILRDDRPVTESAIPTLVKHSKDGSLGDALDALATLRSPKIQERSRTTGGRDVHEETGPNTSVGLILRGRERDTRQPDDGLLEDILTAQEAMAQEFGDVLPIVIDASHGNGAMYSPDRKKSPEGQLRCLEAIARHLGDPVLRITGVMFESNLLAGADTTANTPGMSRTDPCIGHQDAVDAVEMLSAVFEARQTAVRVAA
jgi:3-deoxy-D-arabino-heptulosonate 7-phosphate (DAHP) synthase